MGETWTMRGAVQSMGGLALFRLSPFNRMARFDGVHNTGVSRLNSDGSTDYTFMHGFSEATDIEFFHVYSVAIQNDGKVLIGGWFRSVNGVGRNVVERLWGAEIPP